MQLNLDLLNLGVVNLEETRPQQEAVAIVPETMATEYKVLPLTLKDNVLTVAIGDPNNLTALDDLRNFLGNLSGLMEGLLLLDFRSLDLLDLRSR